MSDTLSSTSYFTFLFGDVSYAVEVTSVKEVLPLEKITPVPRTADYLKGVINIRGSVVSIIDFRVLFGLPVSEPGKDTSIIVAEVIDKDGTILTFGFIADSVTGVGLLDKAPSAASNKTPFVKLLGHIDNSLVLILDLYKIFHFVEEDSIKQTKTM